MNENITILSNKIFNKIILWAKESQIRAFIVLFILVVVGIPTISGLQSFVRNLDYLELLQNYTSFFTTNFTLSDIIILIILLALIFFFIRLKKDVQKSELINENFDGSLDSWNIPLNAGWTIQSGENVIGKMLSVTNSSYPGTLKPTYTWYDYLIEFETRIDGSVKNKLQNFTLFVRAENNFNGVMLQFSKTHLIPHLLYNGTFIKDTENTKQLPTILAADEWIGVKVEVKGDTINISLYGQNIQYKIPAKVIHAPNNILNQNTPEITLKKLEVEAEKRIESMRAVLQEDEELFKLPKDTEGLEDRKAASLEKLRNIVDATKVILEYQKGSVGFREAGTEKAFFRKLKIKKI